MPLPYKPQTQNLYPFNNERYNDPNSFLLDSDHSKFKSYNSSNERSGHKSYDYNIDKAEYNCSIEGHSRYVNRGGNDSRYEQEFSNEYSGFSSSLSPQRGEFKYYDDYQNQMN